MMDILLKEMYKQKRVCVYVCQFLFNITSCLLISKGNSHSQLIKEKTDS